MPWREDELRLVLSALALMATSLTPSPVALASLAEKHDGNFRGWRRLLAAAASGEDDLKGLDAWTRLHLEALAELEATWPPASGGKTLLHVDLRADNLLITADRVVVVDWPHAALGAAWVDLMFLLPSVAMQGGPMPWELFDAHPGWN